MFSTLTEKGATKTLEALSLGASDFVTKPSNTTSMAVQHMPPSFTTMLAEATYRRPGRC